MHFPSVSSPLVLVRLLVAIVIMTVGMNLIFLTPLESALSSTDQWFPSSASSLFHYYDPTSTTSTNYNSTKSQKSTLSEEEGRQYILDLFQEAKVHLTPEQKDMLPSWSQLEAAVGKQHPYILGLDQCQRYRDKVPPLERMLGSAGMFNTGTNLVTHLLKQNCEIPERRELMGEHQSKESYGMRWQVPWGKHTPAKFRLAHATEKAQAINKEYILPVVTMRHPYSWMKSMCQHPYEAKWHHGKRIPDNCPNLLLSDVTEKWNEVDVKYALQRMDHHQSLAHLWNEWYSYYITQTDFPFVVVRMEDLIFFPKATTTAICECAGGKIRTDQRFKYVVDSAKADSPGHDKSTGIVTAWAKYAQPPPPRYNFSETDYRVAKEVLDTDRMTALGYQHPPAN